MTKYAIFATGADWVGVAFTEQGLCRVVLPDADYQMVREELLQGSRAHWLEVTDTPYQQEISAYLSGEKPALDFPIDWSWATPFQRDVLEVVRKIPYGTTESYGSVAAMVGKPLAARAVGGALGKNRVPLVIPCHRVLATGKRLGGFSSRHGLKDKQALLSLEGIAYCK